MRGHSITMDKLTPKLIRRAQKEKFDAVIIDPIYKVLTGSENDAEQMAKFTNNFDKVAMELGTSVIYCHHHSKGAQGGKSSMDRSSGSGVFARDPDAILDLIELEVTKSSRDQQKNRAISKFYADIIRDEKPAYFPEIGQDDFLSAAEMRKHLTEALGTERAERIAGFELGPLSKRVDLMTAWRLEGTLREFPKFDSVNLWFNYPLHYSDDAGVLKDLEPVGSEPPYKRGARKGSEANSSEDKKAARAAANKEKLDMAFDFLMDEEGKVLIGKLAEGIEGQPTVQTVKKWLKNYSSEYEKDEQGVVRKVVKSHETI